MDELMQLKEKTKLEKYLKNQGRQDFIEEVDRMSVDQLDSKMLGLAKHREEITNTKNRDEELREADNKKKVLEAPYKEQKRMNEKLTRYVALVMEEKGGNI